MFNSDIQNAAIGSAVILGSKDQLVNLRKIFIKVKACPEPIQGRLREGSLYLIKLRFEVEAIPNEVRNLSATQKIAGKRVRGLGLGG